MAAAKTCTCSAPYRGLTLSSMIWRTSYFGYILWKQHPPYPWPHRCVKDGELNELYNSMDGWLQLSQTRQVPSNQNYGKCVNLGGSLTTLDVSWILQDVVSQMKGCI